MPSHVAAVLYLLGRSVTTAVKVRIGDEEVLCSRTAKPPLKLIHDALERQEIVGIDPWIELSDTSQALLCLWVRTTDPEAALALLSDGLKPQLLLRYSTNAVLVWIPAQPFDLIDNRHPHEALPALAAALNAVPADLRDYLIVPPVAENAVVLDPTGTTDLEALAAWADARLEARRAAEEAKRRAEEEARPEQARLKAEARANVEAEERARREAEERARLEAERLAKEQAEAEQRATDEAVAKRLHAEQEATSPVEAEAVDHALNVPAIPAPSDEVPAEDKATATDSSLPDKSAAPASLDSTEPLESADVGDSAADTEVEITETNPTTAGQPDSSVVPENDLERVVSAAPVSPLQGEPASVTPVPAAQVIDALIRAVAAARSWTDHEVMVTAIVREAMRTLGTDEVWRILGAGSTVLIDHVLYGFLPGRLVRLAELIPPSEVKAWYVLCSK